MMNIMFKRKLGPLLILFIKYISKIKIVVTIERKDANRIEKKVSFARESCRKKPRAKFETMVASETPIIVNMLLMILNFWEGVPSVYSSFSSLKKFVLLIV